MIRVNGMAIDVVPATDRGLAYGDGVFRTLAVRGGRPQHWARHYAKLVYDCRRVGIPSLDEAELHADLVAVTCDYHDAAVKIIVTRGSGERGYRVPALTRPHRVVIASPLPQYPPQHSGAGIALYQCQTRLASQPALAGVKHLNRLENVLARAEWEDERYAEGLLQDADGHVICGTMTNLFIVEDHALHTPDLARCGVAGVTRDRVLAAAARHGMACSVQVLSLERVLAADEVFVVNTLIGLWRVQAIGSAPVRTGGIAELVRTWLDEAETNA